MPNKKTKAQRKRGAKGPAQLQQQQGPAERLDAPAANTGVDLGAADASNRNQVDVTVEPSTSTDFKSIDTSPVVQRKSAATEANESESPVSHNTLGQERISAMQDQDPSMSLLSEAFRRRVSKQRQHDTACRTSVRDLFPISLQDLVERDGHNSRDRILSVRVQYIPTDDQPADHTRQVVTIGNNGIAAVLSVYCISLRYSTTELFPVNALVHIKAPMYMTTSAEQHKTRHTLQVNNPADMIIDPVAADGNLAPQDWLAQAHQHHKAQAYHLALACYNKAMGAEAQQPGPTDHQTVATILFPRASVHLCMGHWRRAELDAVSAGEHVKQHCLDEWVASAPATNTAANRPVSAGELGSDALRAQAMYCQQRFGEARALAQRGLDTRDDPRASAEAIDAPEMARTWALLKQVRHMSGLRLREQDSGDYAQALSFRPPGCWGNFVVATCSRLGRLGPKVILAREDRPGEVTLGRRGMFATEHIAAGSIVLVETPVAYCASALPEEEETEMHNLMLRLFVEAFHEVGELDVRLRSRFFGMPGGVADYEDVYVDGELSLVCGQVKTITERNIVYFPQNPEKEGVSEAALYSLTAHISQADDSNCCSGVMGRVIKIATKRAVAKGEEFTLASASE